MRLTKIVATAIGLAAVADGLGGGPTQGGRGYRGAKGASAYHWIRSGMGGLSALRVVGPSASCPASCSPRVVGPQGVVPGGRGPSALQRASTRGRRRERRASSSSSAPPGGAAQEPQLPPRPRTLRRALVDSRQLVARELEEASYEDGAPQVAGIYGSSLTGYVSSNPRIQLDPLAQSPSTYRMSWKAPPRNVLLLKKQTAELLPYVVEIGTWLQETAGVNVLVEPLVGEQLAESGMGGELAFQDYDPVSAAAEGKVIDLVVTVGGDGLVLHLSHMFQGPMPPVMSFAMGSLGFLTPFEIDRFKEHLMDIFSPAGSDVVLRDRLEAQITRNGVPLEGKKFRVLNELSIDRGSSPYLSTLECRYGGSFLTSLVADGLIVATPTGSTAYSLSAGGSMVHPSVAGMLFTPVCAHSLTMRPMVFPTSQELEIIVPQVSRCSAWASFDGKRRQLLRRDDSVVVRECDYPLPTIVLEDCTNDWFSSLQRSFNLNNRPAQKPLGSKAKMALQNEGCTDDGEGSECLPLDPTSPFMHPAVFRTGTSDAGAHVECSISDEVSDLNEYCNSAEDSDACDIF